LHATREDVSSVLKSADDGAARSRSRWSLRGSLLAIQIAISLLLLVNAGVLVRGIQHGRDHDPGFVARGVTLLSFDLPASYDPARTWAFSRQLMDDSRSMDGARIAFASDAPLDQGRMTRYRLPGDPAAREYDAWVVGMSRGLLDVLGMPIVAGRDIEPSDGEDAVLVNQALARSLWPGESALGKVIIDNGERRVVGVVRDASVYRLDRVEDVMFRPIDRMRVPVMLIRSPSPAITQLVTAAAERIDPRVHVRVDSIAGNVERQLGGLRTIAELAGVLGMIALALATVGVFSVFAYFVQRRTREIGIRTALGASSTRIIVLVLRDTGRAIGVGIAIGFAAAVGVARMMQSELFGASAFDPVVFAGTAVLLALAGIVATYVPARRAARVDPMSALRQE
jgi:predicted permease